MSIRQLALVLVLAVVLVPAMALSPTGAPQSPASLVGHWRSVTLEGRHLDDQQVRSMDVLFTEQEMTILSFMRDEQGAEVDVKQAPYTVDAGRVRIQATSTVSSGWLRYRLDGSRLVLESSIPDGGEIRMVCERVP